MLDTLKIFLVIILVVAAWPRFIHVGRHLAHLRSHEKTSKAYHDIRKGFGTKRTPRPGDPPVCMAKLIMLRHRMQQASTRKSQHRVASKPTAVGTLRHRTAPSWTVQATKPQQSTIGSRRWGTNGR